MLYYTILIHNILDNYYSKCYEFNLKMYIYLHYYIIILNMYTATLLYYVYFCFYF